MGGHDHILHSNFVNGLVTQKSGVDFKSFTHVEIQLGPFSDSEKKLLVEDASVHKKDVIVGNGEWKDQASQKFFCETRNNRQMLVTINKIDVTNADAEDEATKTKVQPYIDQVEEEFKEPVLKILQNYDTRFSIIRTRETPFANFLTKLISNWGGFDVAIIQSGHIRCDKILQKNSILTLKECYQIIPITDNIVGIEISGEQVINAMRRSSSRVPDLDGGFANFAGLSAIYDSSKSAGERLDVESVKWRGKAIEMNGKYVIGLTAFLGDCGDGYSCFEPKKYTLTVEDSLNCYQIFSRILNWPTFDYIREEFALMKKNEDRLTDDVLFDAYRKAKNTGEEVFTEKHLENLSSLSRKA